MPGYGKGPFGSGIEFKTEVTNGKCPTCQDLTIFVSIFKNIYRCMNCGADTEQKVNGVIEFMPIVAKGQKVPFLQKIQSDGPKEN